MEIFIVLQDHEETIHDHFGFKVSDSTTFDELKAQIASMFNIETNRQHLFFNGIRIMALGSSKMKAIYPDMKEACSIIVKHSRLTHWTEFLAYLKQAREARAVDHVDRISTSVDTALNHLKQLTGSGFFLAYPGFGATFRLFTTEFSHYVNSDQKYIEMAVQEYFSRVLGDNAECPITTVRCEEKKRSGIQGGLICNVLQSNVVVAKYHIKVHIGLAVAPFNQNADLRELFAYKLLEKINVGPKAHFVPNVHYSGLGLYIATEDVVGFQQADETTMTDEQIAQLDLIRRIFVLKDLHSANYGVDGVGRLSIVDFKVGDNYDRVDKYWKPDKDHAARKQVAKECFELWNLDKTIPLANDAIAQQKALFTAKSIRYKPSRDFETYLAAVWKNFNSILSQCS